MLNVNIVPVQGISHLHAQGITGPETGRPDTAPQAGRESQPCGPGLVADRENLAAAGLTRPRLRDILEGGGVDTEVRAEMERILDACDAARFAPGSVDDTAMQALVKRFGE